MSNKMIRDLDSIDWFGNVGNAIESDLGDIVSVSSWHDATERCGPEWEDVVTKARNDLTMYLNRTCKAEFQDWNNVIGSITKELQEPWQQIREKVMQLNLPTVVADCAEWDTMHALAEEHFRQCNPPVFFAKLLKVYELGHFPCGWNGTWPDGNLVIF